MTSTTIRRASKVFGHASGTVDGISADPSVSAAIKEARHARS